MKWFLFLSAVTVILLVLLYMRLTKSKENASASEFSIVSPSLLANLPQLRTSGDLTLEA